MKQKPAVKNELFLEDSLTLNNEDKGVTLRAAVQWGEMVSIKVHQPINDEYRKVYILLTEEQMESLITLWNEWKDEIEDEPADIHRASESSHCSDPG